MRNRFFSWPALTMLASVLLFSWGAFAGEQLRFTTCEWEPYYGSKLLDKGYVSEITREAFKAAGYEIDIWFVPWNRALHDAKTGHYDALMGLYHSEDRAKWITFSEPIGAVQNVFFSLKGKNIRYETLEDLKPYRIGIERGYTYSKEFDEAGFLKKEPARKIEINFNKLLKGRVDLVAASKTVFLHNMKKKFPDQIAMLEVLPKPLTVNKIFNGFVKTKPDHKKWVGDFNRGLKIIRENGTYEQILAKHGFKIN